jgi:NAD(P)-dependent dehydrogenase (short-subunit alcohol dehydrogenase family)
MKKILIIGSEGQVGKVFTSHLLEKKYRVIGLDLPKVSHNHDIQYFSCDITDSKQLDDALSSIDDSLDVLINLAGVSVFTPFQERSEEEIDFVLNVNIKSNIIITKMAFNKFFKSQNKGCIVNMGSIYGLVSGDMNIYNDGDRRTPEVYGASKAAVINLTKYFATYMAEHNVRVNCISPGGIFNNHNDDFNKKYSKKVPLKRMAECNEMIPALDYLISDKASYTTGQNIIVDGGLTLW